MHPPAVQVDGVHKSFPRRRPIRELVRDPFHRSEKVHALRGVSFEIASGEVVGLLGPNGAGKTTLLKTLCGLVLPDQGKAAVLGVSTGSGRLPEVLGLVHGEERSFYWRLTARENLQFFARLQRIPSAVRGARISELLERVHLTADADRRFSDFSSGMRQRLAIARALLADPPVLLMDEPTRSLDPVSAAEQREWIRTELHEQGGKTILIATHNLKEAETLCDRVVVLSKGEVRATGSPLELRRRGLHGLVYRMKIGGPGPGLGAEEGLLEHRPGADGTAEIDVWLPEEEALEDRLARLRERGLRLLAIAPHEPDLEEAFRRLVQPQEAGPT